MMEMEGKKCLLLIVAGLWLAMLGIVALLYYLMRRRNQRGERLMDEAVNESVNTEPMGKGELLVYLISIAVFFVYRHFVDEQGTFSDYGENNCHAAHTGFVQRQKENGAKPVCAGDGFCSFSGGGVELSDYRLSAESTGFVFA